MQKKSLVSLSKANRISAPARVLMHLYLMGMVVFIMLPLVLIISISFSNEMDIINYGFRIIPKNIDLTAYSVIFKSPEKILNSYRVTLLVTILGTGASVLICSMMAYPLARRDFIFRRFLSFYLFFIMLFSGGLVPTYVLITKYLKLQNTYLVLIAAHLVNPFNVFLIRTNFQKIPDSLIESARIDGAGEFTIYWRLIMPLSTPVLATAALIVSLAYWNDWFTSVLYITRPKLYSLQMLLRMMLEDLRTVRSDMLPASMLKDIQMPTENLRMAMCLIAIGPIIILFPFLQKYFVQGLTVGSVKG